MATRNKPASNTEPIEQGLGDDPLADVGADAFAAAFYGVQSTLPQPATTTATAPTTKKKAAKPRAKGRQPLADGKSFRLVTFSFYEDDVARLDELLAQARAAGHRKASRSQIVRLALRQVNIVDLPDEI
ncbi:MAG TPA: hypothetical protein VGF99_13910 [Myxococcota bacterium]